MIRTLQEPPVETINLQIGAMDIRTADGVFQELRASGVRILRVSETHLILEPVGGGDRLHITSHFQLDVKTDSGHGAGR